MFVLVCRGSGPSSGADAMIRARRSGRPVSAAKMRPRITAVPVVVGGRASLAGPPGRICWVCVLTTWAATALEPAPVASVRTAIATIVRGVIVRKLYMISSTSVPAGTRSVPAGTEVENLQANIFEPEIGMRGDERAHHRNAPFVLHDLDAHTARAKQLLLAYEGLVFTDDDVRDAIQQNRAAAHRAG